MRLFRSLICIPCCLLAGLALGAKAVDAPQFVLIEQFEDINQESIANWMVLSGFLCVSAVPVELRMNTIGFRPMKDTHER